jgi:hypothetical protein
MKSFATINSSQKWFHRLLVLYPRGYREEFGPHMSQLFKDCSREALDTHGTPGLITLWLTTLPDLFKTAFEENFKEITHMSTEKFHRLGKLAFVLGAALFLLVFVISGMETSYNDPLGGTDALIEYSKLGVGPLAMLMFFVGIAALRSAYGDAAGPSAKTGLTLSAFASLVSLVGAIGLGLQPWSNWLDGAWYLFFFGADIMLLGIGLFGLSCMRRNVLAGINWLFALGGLLLPVITLLLLAAQMFIGTQNQLPEWTSQLAIGVTTLSLLAAGLLLQGAAEPAPRASR